MFFENLLSTNANDCDAIYDIILYLKNKYHVTFDYRVITAWKMHVKHEASVLCLILFM